MNLTVTTEYRTRKSDGRSQIVVKGQGKQKTYSYDDAANLNENHGWNAARFCRDVLDIPKDKINWGSSFASSNDSGSRKKFTIATLD